MAPGDAVAKVGMVAEIAKSVKTVTCPRTAPKGTDYVTVIVDTSKLEVWDDDHGTPSFEFVFRYWPQVFRLSSDGRKTIPAYCWGEARWDFEVPVYNITVGGLMAYDVALRTEIRNVPIDSAVVFTMELLEIDDIGDDYADFDPSSNGGGFAQFVLYPKQHSQFPRLVARPVPANHRKGPKRSAGTMRSRRSTIPFRRRDWGVIFRHRSGAPITRTTTTGA